MPINHIILRILDQTYAQALCGDVLANHPKLPIKKYGFLDWKPNVNCQRCLRAAWEIIQSRQNKPK